MPPRTVNPQYSQWMQDFFTQTDYLPSLYQGMPMYGGEGYDISSTDLLEEWGVEHMPPEGIISDYPGYKEQYEVLDYMIGGEKIREGVESERYKLQDLLESVQTTGPEGLRVGGVSRELENQRETINQGLADLEAKKAFGLKAQETELAQGLYDLRAGYEEQASGDYLRWLRDYIPGDAPFIGESEAVLPGGPSGEEFSLDDELMCLSSPHCCDDDGNWICEPPDGWDDDSGATGSFRDCADDEYWSEYFQRCEPIPDDWDDDGTIPNPFD